MPAPLRVVSLLPSATEIVCAVGARASLVGVSHECDHPADVVGLPVMTRCKVRSLAKSGAIDRDVRALVRDVLAVYELELEALREARPDVVVTQDLCDVCAVSYDDVCAAARELANPALEIVNLHPTRLADVLADVLKVGRALGREGEARGVVRDMEQRIERVRARAASVVGVVGAVGVGGAGATARPAVLTLEWIDPVMVGGTWMPELVELAGGRPLVTRPGDHAPTLGREELAALAPDVVLVKPCGFDLARTRAERADLLALLAGFDWPAVRAGRVFAADGNSFFNRPGPRIADSLEILAACTHEELFADLAEVHREHFERLG